MHLDLINNQGKSVVDLYYEARRPLIDEHDDEDMNLLEVQTQYTKLRIIIHFETTLYEFNFFLVQIPNHYIGHHFFRDGRKGFTNN